MDNNIFSGLDWVNVGYSAFMATLIGVLHTWRTRNQQAARRRKLSPWRAVIPDVLIGTFTGMLLSTGIPPHLEKLDNFTGVSMLAGVGGVLGPKIWDLVSSNGLSLLLDYAASAITGPLGNWAKARRGLDGDPDERPQPHEGGGKGAP